VEIFGGNPGNANRRAYADIPPAEVWFYNHTPTPIDANLGPLDQVVERKYVETNDRAEEII
jgi:hypothetical protein